MVSPNFPHNYTAGQTCLYSITVPEEFGKGVPSLEAHGRSPGVLLPLSFHKHTRQLLIK